MSNYEAASNGLHDNLDTEQHETNPPLTPLRARAALHQ
jgi:hypothetical protein